MMFLEQVRNGRNEWYYYLSTLLIVFLAWQVLGAIPLVIYTFIHSPLPLQDTMTGLEAALNNAMRTNFGLVLMILSFGFGLAALLLCVRYLHQKPIRSILTARPLLDWKRIGFSAGLWALFSVVTLGLSFLLGDTSDLVFQFEPLNFFILCLISLFLLPFQTSFEEILFRGYLMQWAALLLKYRWAAVLVTGILFGLLHSANPETGLGFWVVMPQYIFMGILLGYLAVKDDGLELALGLHIANNIIAAVSVTSDSSALQTHALFKSLHPTATHWDTLFLVLAGIIFVWLCNRKYHFMGKIKIWGKINE